MLLGEVLNNINKKYRKIKFNNIKFKKTKHFIGIRPEHLKVNGESDFTFVPEVELIENLGNEKIAYIKNGAKQLSLKISSNEEITNKIGFNSNNILIFDKNGQRIRS